MTRDVHPTVSVVVPVYNEEDALETFFNKMRKELGSLGVSWEIVCVNDGSCDGSFAKLQTYVNDDDRIKVVDLSRNFGKEAALTAGLDHASGQAVVCIDVDLQDPPELIGPMIEKWREGYEMVYATRASRPTDGFLKRISAERFYGAYNLMSSVKIPENTGDFRLMDSKVLDALSRLNERNRFMKGMFAWVGFKSTALEFERGERLKGTTKWSFWKLWNFAIDGLTSFSTLPLRVWTYLGLIIALLSFGFASFIVARIVISGVSVPGYASLMVVVLFLGGLQMISLGVIGEYLGRVYEEVKQRPVYLVRERLGFDALPKTKTEQSRISRRAAAQ